MDREGAAVACYRRLLRSDCEIDQCIAQHSTFFGCKASSVGCSIQHCCSKYGFTIGGISCVTPSRIAKRFFENVESGVVVIARVA